MGNDFSLNENKPNKSCLDFSIDSQQSNSTVNFTIYAEEIFNSKR